MAKVFIVAGPTASGKSNFAYKLAVEKKGVILNGDSLQVYRGLEILTAQPSLDWQKEVPHRLYGFLDPSETCSAGKWLSLVLTEIENIHKEKRVPIVVGGTGLYLKALVEGISPLPPLDSSIRQELQAKPQELLYKELLSVDAALAQHIHAHDRQRTLRGLEVYYGTGKPLSFWQSQKLVPPPYDFEKILFSPSKEELQVHIASRLDEMIEKGLLEEIANVIKKPLSSNAMKAIGLREFDSFLKGQCSFEKAKELTFLHTCQYAKRQRTWFRHQFNPSCN